ncbi:DUF3800 domain-containing protein [Streptococcus lutetiensis]|uniref:DUF3800 domain-containing protein n=1 Tax=Streptococcus lutetiensis TaxID=150055 RepID=UPI003565FDF3
MNIFVYTDESGVFDKKHEDIYVFGGVIFLDANSKDDAGRKYIGAEKKLKRNHRRYEKGELKACRLSNKHKSSLFRSLNREITFSIVIKQSNVLNRIFEDKKSKQRFLDYAYKIGLKRAFEKLIDSKIIKPEEVERLYVFNDEHTTATNGCYELKEALEAEFKNGTYNHNWNKFYPPIFENLQEIKLEYCNSAKKVHIRMADIIANQAYYLSKSGKINELKQKMITHFLP